MGKDVSWPGPGDPRPDLPESNLYKYLMIAADLIAPKMLPHLSEYRLRGGVLRYDKDGKLVFGRDKKEWPDKADFEEARNRLIGPWVGRTINTVLRYVEKLVSL